jgi:hypothetical protein
LVEVLAMSDPDGRRRQQRARNIALMAVLLALVALFYAITIVRMSGS